LQVIYFGKKYNHQINCLIMNNCKKIYFGSEELDIINIHGSLVNEIKYLNPCGFKKINEIILNNEFIAQLLA